MRKIALLGVLLTLPFVFLSSCKKDDEGTIVGKWQLYAIEVKMSDIGFGTDPNEYITDCQKTSWLECAQDGAFTSYDDCLETTATGTWTYVGNTLTTTIGGVEQTRTVKSISNVELVIDATNGYSIGGLGFSMEGMTVLMKYKKIG